MEEEILEALRVGPLSTADLADTLRQDRNAVYRCCCRMEIRKELRSTLEPGKKLLFCTVHKKVVTAAIFQECKDEGHQMAAFFIQVRIWEICIVARAARRAPRRRGRRAA